MKKSFNNILSSKHKAIYNLATILSYKHAPTRHIIHNILKYGEKKRLAVNDAVADELDNVVPSVSTSSTGASGMGLE